MLRPNGIYSAQLPQMAYGIEQTIANLALTKDEVCSAYGPSAVPIDSYLNQYGSTCDSRGSSGNSSLSGGGLRTLIQAVTMGSFLLDNLCKKGCFGVCGTIRDHTVRQQAANPAKRGRGHDRQVMCPGSQDKGLKPEWGETGP